MLNIYFVLSYSIYVFLYTNAVVLPFLHLHAWMTLKSGYCDFMKLWLFQLYVPAFMPAALAASFGHVQPAALLYWYHFGYHQYKCKNKASQTINFV